MSVPPLPANSAELHFDWQEGLAWIVHNVGPLFPDCPCDSMEHLERSTLRVWEDGQLLGPAHQPHTEIRSLGRGRLSHWGNYVVFSTSDNTNPLTNGRKYEIGTSERRLPLQPVMTPDSPDGLAVDQLLAKLRDRASEVDHWLRHERGRRWRLSLRGFAGHHGIDVPALGQQVIVLEDGQQLHACEDPEQVLERDGQAARDGDVLFLSATDGSNPKLNGRTYSLLIEGRAWPVPPPVQAYALGSPVPVSPGLATLARDALFLGLEIPLSTIWGAPPGETAPPRGPNGYHHLLAGLVRHIGAKRVLEIGTWRGESALALAAGLNTSDGMVVTVDMVDNAQGIPAPPQLTRIIGNAVHPRTIQKVLDVFGAGPIDILFVDSAHEYGETIAHMGIYMALLQPALVVLDDIVLCEPMAKLWADLRLRYGQRALNVCDIEPDARSPDAGFGLIDIQGLWSGD